MLDGSGRSSKLGFLTGPSPLIGVNFASLRSVFWRFGARRLKKQIKGALRSKKRRKVSRRLKKQIKVALLSKKRTPESAPGRPKPFRAKVEYSNQLKSYEKSKASFFQLFLPPRGLECVAFEKTNKRCVTLEKTQKCFETGEKTQIKGALLSRKRRKVSRRLKKRIKVALLSKKRTPESAPGRPKPFRAKV